MTKTNQPHAIHLAVIAALVIALDQLTKWTMLYEVGIAQRPPIEVTAFFRLVMVWNDGVSFGMFSPRVGAGLWLALPQVRIGVSIFTEYFWRWVGNDSAFVHGLTLELQPNTGPLLRPRATSSPSAPSRR